MRNKHDNLNYSYCSVIILLNVKIDKILQSKLYVRKGWQTLDNNYSHVTVWRRGIVMFFYNNDKNDQLYRQFL